MNTPVLVLNANYEPINVCNTKRAIGLVLVGKATVVENGRGWIHTVRRAYERPSVIRLHTAVRRPRLTVALCKREVLRRDGYRCQYCGRSAPDLTIDHVLPRHRGGTHTWENVVAACSQCNRRKGARTCAEAHMVPLRPPAVPYPSAEYLFGHYVQENSAWAKFLEGW